MDFSGCELIVERGRIRSVSPNASGVVIRTERSEYSFPGCIVLPGLVDAHIHLRGLGKRFATPSLHHATSLDECVDILTNTVDTNSGWLMAMGWNQEQWTPAVMPTKASLTAAFPTTPVVCSRIDGHALWCNQKALELAGISHHTGVLVDAEMDAMWQAIPPDTTEQIQQQLISASHALARAGVTEVHDMDVAPNIVAITRELAENARLAVRVQQFVSAQNQEWVNAGVLPAGGELQRTAGIKLYADGALGSRGAALLDPYSDAATNGNPLLSADAIATETLRAIHAGWWCVAVHAIGDAAVRTTLDAFERVRADTDGGDAILRIEHAQVVNPQDLHRFSELNVFASIQPTHAESDEQMARERLGASRLHHAYRWKSLIDSGARICTGTDAPVERESALRTIDVAVNGMPGATKRNVEECLSVHEAVHAATTWAHEAAGVDYRRGHIDVGMDADFVILGNTIDRQNIQATPIVATFLSGIKQLV